jgi:hypothetical protein
MLGQAYITNFRLQGPYATEESWAVMSNELFEPVVARGLLSNLIFCSLIWMFGCINLFAYSVEKITGM